MTRVLVVPAAGRGVRLQSALPKVLTPVAGRPMIDHVLAKYVGVCHQAVIVVSPDSRPLVAAHLSSSCIPAALAEQAAPTGMLDAILAAAHEVGILRPDRVWITWCDQVAVSARTVERLAAAEDAHPDAAAVLPLVRQSPPYIHFDRDDVGRLSGVRHRREGDSMPDVGTSDAGLFALSVGAFATWLPAYAASATVGARTGERNFLPFLPWLAERAPVESFEIPAFEAQGINTPDDLAAIERRLAAEADRL